MMCQPSNQVKSRESTNFTNVNGNGNSNTNDASNSEGVRPDFVTESKHR